MKSLADVLGLTSEVQTPDSAVPTQRTAKQFSKSILDSPQYRESVLRRILADSLPPAVETKLYDYAYGKPVDRVEVKDTTDRLDELSSEELESRALALAVLAKKLRGEEDTQPVPGIH